MKKLRNGVIGLSLVAFLLSGAAATGREPTRVLVEVPPGRQFSVAAGLCALESRVPVRFVPYFDLTIGETWRRTLEQRDPGQLAAYKRELGSRVLAAIASKRVDAVAVVGDTVSNERDEALVKFVRDGGMLIWVGLPKRLDPTRPLHKLLPVGFDAQGMPVLPTDGKNLLVNGDFENGRTGWKLSPKATIVPGGPSGKGHCLHIAPSARYEAHGPNLIDVAEGDHVVLSFDWRQLMTKWGPNLHTGLEPHYAKAGKYPRGLAFDFTYFGGRTGIRVENGREPVFYLYTYKNNWNHMKVLATVRRGGGLEKLRVWQVARTSPGTRGFQIDNVRLERVPRGVTLPPPPKVAGKLVRGDARLLEGVPLDGLPVTRFPTFLPNSRPGDRVLVRTDAGFPLAILRTVGKGRVLLFALETDGGFFPRCDIKLWEQLDTDAVWSAFWARIFALAKRTDKVKLPVAASTRAAPSSGGLAIAIATDPNKPGWRVGERMRLVTTVRGKLKEARQADVRLALWDYQGRAIHFDSKKVTLPAGGEASAAFPWTMPDLGTAGWFFWATAECVVPNQGSAWTYTHVDRFKPYSCREQWQWSAWTTLEGKFARSAIPHLMRLYEDAGLNALGQGTSKHDRFWARRWGFRQYTELPSFGGIDNIGWPKASMDEFLQKLARRWPWINESATVAVASYGEEPGFGPAGGTTWHWGNGPAPEGATRWFRKYLRRTYQDDVAKLNAQWQTAFKSFDDILLEEEYSIPIKHTLPLPKGYKLPANLSRHVDTHAFYHWYFRTFSHTWRRAMERLNPTACAVMSMDTNFLTQLDVVGMYNHWLYPKEYSACYYAYQRQFARDPAGFFMNWGFFEDPRVNAQLYLLSLAQGACTFSFWYDTPFQFNPDLTHTRASLQFRRLRAQLDPKAALLLKTRPYVDREIGMYLPLLDWKTAMGRPAWMVGLRELGQNPPWAAGYGSYELPYHSALCESGYAPRFVGPKQFAECKVLVAPYCQSVPRDDARRLAAFVRGGGTLVASAKLATHDVHGKPFDVAPGEGLSDLFGLKVEPTLKRAYGVVHLDADAPITFPKRYLPGGEPYRLQSFGHQAVKHLADGVTVLARHSDGHPAVLMRKVGKGTAIYLNLVYFWPEGWYTFFSQGRESLRVFLQQVLTAAGVKPSGYFLEKDSDYGSYAEPSWAVYPYESLAGGTKHLRIYSDWRRPELDAKLVLRGPVRRVRDVTRDKDLRVETIGDVKAVRLRMKPAEFRILALVEHPAKRVALSLSPPAPRPGRVATLTVSILGQDGKPLPHPRPVTIHTTGPSGRRVALLSSHLTVTGRAKVQMPIAVNDAGRFRVTAFDPTDGLEASIAFTVQADPRAPRLPRPVPRFDVPGGAPLAGTTDAEFLGRLRRLKEIYLGKIADRRHLLAHYYCWPTGSRHAALERLWRTSWPKHVNALGAALAAGETLVLLPEDLNVDVEDGKRVYPHVDGLQLDAIETLARGQGAQWWASAAHPDYRVLRIGKGCLILCRTSPDLSGWRNTDVQNWHRRFQRDLRRLGLTGTGPFKPAADLHALPTGLDVRKWLHQKGTQFLFSPGAGGSAS